MSDPIAWVQGAQQLVSRGPCFVVIGDAYRQGDTTAVAPRISGNAVGVSAQDPESPA